jgi:hypothetical protein
MEGLWVTTAEVAVQPGDVSSGDTLGFMRVFMWASSEENFAEKLREYLAEYQWSLLSMENTSAVDPSRDYGDEENQMIDEMLRDHSAVRLGTYYSYKPD